MENYSRHFYCRVLGGVVGIERENQKLAAGLRTHSGSLVLIGYDLLRVIVQGIGELTITLPGSVTTVIADRFCAELLLSRVQAYVGYYCRKFGLACIGWQERLFYSRGYTAAIVF